MQKRFPLFRYWDSRIPILILTDIKNSSIQPEHLYHYCIN